MNPISTPHRRRLFAQVWAVFCFLTCAAAAEAAERSIEVASLNATYEGAANDLQPVEQGPLTIHVASPAYRLTVYRNRFAFSPAKDGVLEATVEGEVEGAGQLVAVVEAAGSRSDFNDRLAVPRQTVAVTGKVRLERAEGGYRFTVVEAPATVAVTIRSDGLGRILTACSTLSRMPFLPLSCDGLEQALTTARVPGPKPGESFVLSDSSLSAAERAFFDRLGSP